MSPWMVFLFAKHTIAELFVQGSRLEAERAEKSGAASARSRLLFRHGNQSGGLSVAAEQAVDPDVVQVHPGTPQVSERSTDDFTLLVAEKEIVGPPRLLRQPHRGVGMR